MPGRCCLGPCLEGRFGVLRSESPAPVQVLLEQAMALATVAGGAGGGARGRRDLRQDVPRRLQGARRMQHGHLTNTTSNRVLGVL